MALRVMNPTIHRGFDVNDVRSFSACSIIPTEVEEKSVRNSTFFDDQIDLTSEIMSFLDVESLLNVCQVSKVFPSCLRHDHVITSALSTSSPLQLTSTSLPISPHVSRSMFTMNKDEKKAQHFQEEKEGGQPQSANLPVEQTREFTIMKRLLQVFEHYNSIKGSKSGALYTMAMQNVERPSPIRLLRLVNGKKCERCHRRLSPSSKGSSIILPSLTFGKFCCTNCIFK